MSEAPGDSIHLPMAQRVHFTLPVSPQLRLPQPPPHQPLKTLLTCLPLPRHSGPHRVHWARQRPGLRILPSRPFTAPDSGSWSRVPPVSLSHSHSLVCGMRATQQGVRSVGNTVNAVSAQGLSAPSNKCHSKPCEKSSSSNCCYCITPSLSNPNHINHVICHLYK